MWNPHDKYLALGTTQRTRSKAYCALFTIKLDQELISEIRFAADVGLALAKEKFKKEVERFTGQRQHPQERGPKPKPQSQQDEEFLL